MAYTDQQFAQLLQIIANSKLFSELTEQTVISDDSFFASINTGEEDARKIKLPLLRGYSGDWNASTNTPALVNGAGVSATIYRVGVAGNRDLGNGAITYGLDEIIYYNGAKWVKLIQSQISDIVGLQEALDALQTGLYPQGNWNANTNTPDIALVAETGYYWIVNVAGSTDLGGITDWKVNDWAIKTADSWAKIDNTDKITEVIAGDGLTGGGDEGALTLNAVGGDGITVNANDIQVDSTVVRTSDLTANNITLDDTNLIVAKETNVQAFAEVVDSSLLKARGTGVSTTYISTVVVGGTTFSQPAVKGEIMSDEGYFNINYAGATGITVANLTVGSTYVYIDSTGALQQQTSIPTREDWSRKVFTMRIAIDLSTNTVIGFEYLNNPIGHYSNSIRDVYSFLLKQGIPFKEDQTVTGRANDLGFDVSAGSIMEFGGTGDINNANIKSINSVSNATFFLAERTTFDAGGNTDLPKFWDNNGVLTALGSTTLVGHRLYRFSNGNLVMQYGQGNYANMTLAKAGVVLEDYVLNPILKNSTFFGWWFIESTATNTGGTTLTDFVEYTIGIQGGSSSGLSGCLLKGNNLSDLLDVSAARTNLGLGNFTDPNTFTGDLTITGDVSATKAVLGLEEIVTDKAKHQTFIYEGTQPLFRHQTSVWTGSNWFAVEGYGFGLYALQNNTGRNSNGFGYATLYNNTGRNSNGFGYRTLYDNTGNDVLAIGHEAGKTNTLDNQFIVQQANVNATPLIQGDFLTGALSFASSVSATDGLFSGNLGIGTDNPYGDLHLSGSGQQDIVLTNSSAEGIVGSTIARLISQAKGSSNNGAEMASIDFETNATSWYKGDIVFKTNNSDGTNVSVSAVERLRIASDGAATFASSVSATDANLSGNLQFQFNSANTLRIESDAGGGSYYAAAGLYHRWFNSGVQSLILNSDQSATFASSVSATDEVSVQGLIPKIQIKNTDTSLGVNQVLGDIDFYQSDPSGGVGVVSRIRSINSSSFQGQGELSFQTGTTAGIAEALRLSFNGAATFASSVSATSLQLNGTNEFNILSNNDGGNLFLNSSSRGFVFRNGNGNLLTISNTGAATFASSVSVGGDLIFSGGPRTISGALNQSLYINSKPNSANEGTIFQINGVDKLSLLQDGSATFASSVSATEGNFSGKVNIGSTNSTGKLNVSGVSEGDVYFMGANSNARALQFSTFATASPFAGHRINATSGNGKIALAISGTDALTVNSDLSATFASSVSVGGDLIFPIDNGVGRINASDNFGSLSFGVGGTNDALVIASNKSATFASSLTAQALRTDASNTGFNLLSRNSIGTTLYVNQAGSGSIAQFSYGSATAGSGTSVLLVEQNGIVVGGSATFASSVSVGGDLTVGGDIALGNQEWLTGRNFEDTTDVLLIGLDTNNIVKIDAGGYGTLIFADLKVGNDLEVDGELSVREPATFLSSVSATDGLFSGQTFFGTTGAPNGTSVYGSAFITNSSNRKTLFQATSTTASSTMQGFFNPNGLVGTIATSGSATSYNTSSDYRLKEDLKDFNGLEMISNIPVYDHKWKVDESRSYSVLAHELQEVLPQAVSGEKDAEEMQGVDYSKIVPLLIKSIQELKAEVELLKNK